MADKREKQHKLIPANFFKDNPPKDFSTQRLIYSTFLHDGLEKLAGEATAASGILGAERMDQINREKEMIAAQIDPEAIIDLLRKSKEMINRPVLVAKALEYEAEIMPKVVEKLFRNNHDVFIENAIQLLQKSREDYSAPLKERFSEIRSPYVQSLVCLIIGFRSDETAIPWMLERYDELKRLYPNETYAQGPLLAIAELNARFTENSLPQPVRH